MLQLFAKRIFIGFLTMSIFVGISFSDVINLNDGTVLIGVIKGTSGNKVKLQSGVTGEISVGVANIDSVATDKEVYVAFENGNTVFGQLMDDRGRAKIRTSEGTLDVSQQKISAIWC